MILISDNEEYHDYGDNEETCATNEEMGTKALTYSVSGITVDNEDNGLEAMTDDPRLEQAFELIRAVIADADKRAEDKLVSRITGSAPSRPAQPQLFEDTSPDKRAPRGSAAMLIDRALDEAGDKGLTPIGIQAKAETAFEKMVSTSAIRNWLKEGERKRPPRYRQVGGVWFLAGRGPAMKVVGER